MKRIGLIIVLLGCQVYATSVVVHVLPLAVEFKKIEGRFEPQWYLLLGKNTGKDDSFVADIFQEFGGTWELEKGKVLDARTLWNLAINTYLADGTNNIYNFGDLSSLIKKQPDGYFKDQVYNLPGVKDTNGIWHDFVYVLLDVRKPMARLNTDGRNPYKSEFKWILVSDVQKFSEDELKKQNIDKDLKILLSEARWNNVELHFTQKMCSKN